VTGAGEEAAHGVRERVRRGVDRRLGIDARGLAALRIALGLLILLDLALRARSLRAHYTDAGILPRSALRARYGALADLSIHAISGAAWVQTALFLLAVVVAVALLLGYRTTLATALSWLLLASLHARNPLLLNAGDSLFRRLLFWGIFLPLGARWSIDAGPRSTGTRRVVGVASAALLLQVVAVYTVNGLFKLRGDLWRSGEAIRYVFGLDRLTVLFGDRLAEVPVLLGLFDRLWFAMVLGSVGLILLTGWLRAGFALLFVAMHAGMALTMRLGVFPLVSIAALLVFLPPSVWDRIEGYLSGSAVARAGETIRDRIDRVRASVPVGRLPAVPDIPAIRTWRTRVTSAFLLGIVVMVVLWNAAALGYATLPVDDSPVSPREHRWDMFAPRPLGVDVWFVVPGRLESGARVDAFHRGPVKWDKPPDAADSYSSARWRKALMDLRRPRYADLRPAFAGYLCDRWNRSGADDLVSLSIYAVEQPTRLDGPEPTRRVRLWNGTCSSVGGR
jgi:hypothetical protein